MAPRTLSPCPSLRSPPTVPCGPWGITPDSLRKGGHFFLLPCLSPHTSRECPKNQWVGGPGKLSIALANFCLRSRRLMSLRKPKTKISPEAHRPRRERLGERKLGIMARVAVTQALTCLHLLLGPFKLWNQASCQLQPQPHPTASSGPGCAEFHGTQTATPKLIDNREESLLAFSQNSAENKPSGTLQRH